MQEKKFCSENRILLRGKKELRIFIQKILSHQSFIRQTKTGIAKKREEEKNAEVIFSPDGFYKKNENRL